ncbi:MAG TPA: META domain-containing protein [Rhodothermales bacterium]
MSPVARRLSLLVVLPALILSACLIVGPDFSRRAGAPNGTTWILQEVLLSGVVVDARSLDPPANLTFGTAERTASRDRQETGAVEGYSGCNDLNARYMLEEESAGSGTLQFTEVTHTERACDGLQGQVDGLVLMGVRHADRFEIRDGVLRIGVAPDAPAPALTMEFVEAE